MSRWDDIRRAEAAEWFAVQRRGALTLEEQARFDAWRSERANQSALDSMHQLWGETSALKGVLVNGGSSAPRRRANLGAALAAGLALTVAGGLLAVRGLDPWRAQRTDVGELAAKTLPDGSVVNMNVVTRLDYRMKAERREVRLKEGEALFMVHKDAARPFFVTAGDYKVRAVGTAFNVRRRDGDVQVAVSEGVVSVTATSGPMSGREIARLHAGQKIDLAAATATAEPVKVSATPVQSVAEWRLRTVSYEDASVAQVVEDLNRFFPRPLEVDDPILAARRVTLRLQVGDRQRTLDTLSGLLGVRISPTAQSDILSAG